MSPTMRARFGAGLMLIAATGCTTLREIPPSQYTAKPERSNVRLTTRDGLAYEFEFVRVNKDTLLGYRSHEVEGLYEEVAAFQLPLSEVASLSSRGVDWKRTTLIGGGVVVAVAAIGLASTAGDQERDPNASGGSGRPPTGARRPR